VIQKLEFYIQRQLPDSLSLSVNYPDNPRTQLDTSFYILSTDLRLSFEDKIFDLRNSRILGGDEEDNLFNAIVIDEHGANPLLHKGDTLLVKFPPGIKNITIQKGFREPDWGSLKIKRVKTEATKYQYLECVIKEDFSSGEVLLSGIELVYPTRNPKMLDWSHLKFKLVNSYTPATDLKYQEITGRFAIAAGQPEYFFKDEKDKGFIINDKSRPIPPIVIKEDKFKRHIVVGGSIFLHLKEDNKHQKGFPAIWDTAKVDLFTKPEQIFDSRIEFIDERTAKLNVIGTLDLTQEVELEGLHVTGYEKVFIPDDPDSSSLEIWGGEVLYPDPGHPQRFAYDFDKGEWLQGRLVIGKVELEWIDKAIVIKQVDQSGTVPNLKLVYRNIENDKDIPDTFYLKLRSWEKNFEGELIPTNNYLWGKSYKTYGDINITKSFETTDNDEIKTSWLECNFVGRNKKKIRVDELVLTTSLPQYGIEEGFYDVQLYFDQDAQPIAITYSQNEIKRIENVDYCGKEYLSIFDVSSVSSNLSENKRISLSIEQDSTESPFRLQFVELATEIALVKSSPPFEKYADVEWSTLNDSIHFTLQKSLLDGEEFKIKGIVLDFEDSDVPIGVESSAELVVTLDIKDFDDDYYPENYKVVVTHGAEKDSLVYIKHHKNPIDLNCIFKKLKVRRSETSDREFHIVFDTPHRQQVDMPQFKVLAKALYKQYQQYLSGEVSEQIITETKIDNGLTEANELILKQQGLNSSSRLSIKDPAYQWCLALFYYLEDPLSQWDKAKAHYDEFENRRKTLNGYVWDGGEDLYQGIGKLKLDPKIHKKEEWEQFEGYVEKKQWNDSFRFLYERSKGKEDYFTDLLIEDYPQIEFLFDENVAKIALGLNDFKYGRDYIKEMSVKNDIKYPDKKGYKQRDQTISKLKRNINNKEESIYDSTNSVSGWDGIKDIKKDKNFRSYNPIINDENERNKEDRTVELRFSNDFQCSVNYYSSNHVLGPGKDTYIVLYPDVEDIQEIYGGGEYLFIPNTKELAKKESRKNWVVAGLVATLAIGKYYVTYH